MLSEKPWKIDAVMLLGSAIFLCLFATVSIGLGLQFLLPNLPADDVKFYTFLANTLGFQGMTLLLVTVFLQHHSLTWGEFLGLQKSRLRRFVLLGLGIGFLLVPVELLINKLMADLITWLQMTPEHQPTIKVLQVSVSPWKRVCFGIAAIGLAPVAEEIIFRGILYPTIKQVGHPHAAIWITSLVFAAIHSNLMTFVPLLVFSLVMIWLYERTDSLLTPIVAHALFNAANFTLFFIEPQLKGS